MEIRTTRFGSLDIAVEDIIHFPSGMIGLENCLDWVLLADAHHDVLAWLQSTTRPEIALAVVSPRRFVPEYRVHLFRREIAPLHLKSVNDAQVLVVLGKNDRNLTLNLKAPLIINVEQRLGRQVIHNGEQQVQYELTLEPVATKKIA